MVTMSQKSSVPQAAKSVSQVLIRDTRPKRNEGHNSVGDEDDLAFGVRVIEMPGYVAGHGPRHGISVVDVVSG